MSGIENIRVVLFNDNICTAYVGSLRSAYLVYTSWVQHGDVAICFQINGVGYRSEFDNKKVGVLSYNSYLSQITRDVGGINLPIDFDDNVFIRISSDVDSVKVTVECCYECDGGSKGNMNNVVTAILPDDFDIVAGYVELYYLYEWSFRYQSDGYYMYTGDSGFVFEHISTNLLAMNSAEKWLDVLTGFFVYNKEMASRVVSNAKLFHTILNFTLPVYPVMMQVNALTILALVNNYGGKDTSFLFEEFFDKMDGWRNRINQIRELEFEVKSSEVVT